MAIGMGLMKDREVLIDSARLLSLSLAGTWRSQRIVLLYQDCEMDIVVGIKIKIDNESPLLCH
jgi:hypothetical protein